MEDPGRGSVALVWFRRDLRLADAPALLAALSSAATVIPVFIWAVEEEGQFQPGRQTRWWFKHSVRHLAARLSQLGSRLVLRRAQDSATALRALVRETGTGAVFFNHLYDSISMVRDQQIKDELRGMGVAVHTFNADLLYEPWQVLDSDGQPFTTFKSYWDRCLAMPYPPPLPLPEPRPPLPDVPEEIASLGLEEVDWFMTREQEASTEALAHRWDPSGEEAVRRLEAFLSAGLPSFEHDRAKTDRESTTMLSPWIHAGSISVRHIYYRVAQKHAEWQGTNPERGAGCLDFVQQLGYREYSRYLSFHFPFMTDRAMLAHLRAVPWRLDQAAFKAWRQGLTGYPLVDAGMRQLWSTGWCHNRVRVVAASFLVKHLLLPWQWGLKHLWDCQIDADLECDALGWQYVAGCLEDAHPFSYMIDLDQEWRRFDPEGRYVRRWLPVLSQLPTRYVHQPWRAPKDVLEAAGVELGFNYPFPIISPEAARSGVDFAASVVERCYASQHPASDLAANGGSGGEGGGSGTGTGTRFRASGTPGSSAQFAEGGGARGPSGSSGSSGAAGTGGGGGGSSAMPRKEPYRPPTDPALMAAFLEAAREGASWQGRLPELHDVERAARAVLSTGAAFDAAAPDAGGGSVGGYGGAAARPGHPFYVGRGVPAGTVGPAPSASAVGSCQGWGGAGSDSGDDAAWMDEEREVEEEQEGAAAAAAAEGAAAAPRAAPRRRREERDAAAGAAAAAGGAREARRMLKIVRAVDPRGRPGGGGGNGGAAAAREREPEGQGGDLMEVGAPDEDQERRGVYASRGYAGVGWREGGVGEGEGEGEEMLREEVGEEEPLEGEEEEGEDYENYASDLMGDSEEEGYGAAAYARRGGVSLATAASAFRGGGTAGAARRRGAAEAAARQRRRRAEGCGECGGGGGGEEEEPMEEEPLVAGLVVGAVALIPPAPAHV